MDVNAETTINGEERMYLRFSNCHDFQKEHLVSVMIGDASGLDSRSVINVDPEELLAAVETIVSLSRKNVQSKEMR